MNRTKLTRTLRITWTAFWGLAAVLLIVLWVRSYWVSDGLARSNATSLGMSGIVSTRGQILLYRVYYVPVPPGLSGLQFFSDRISESKHRFPVPTHYIQNNRMASSVRIPHFFIVLIFGLLTVVPWLALKRFSLRTLLIVTTFVAVTLGLIVWAMR